MNAERMASEAPHPLSLFRGTLLRKVGFRSEICCVTTVFLIFYLRSLLSLFWLLLPKSLPK